MTTDAGRRFHGLYRAYVSSSTDAERRGRLQVRIPSVLGDDSVFWAEPCVPYGGRDAGMYVVPDGDAGVWVQFVEGDPTRPVWLGFWRGGPVDQPKAAVMAPPQTPQIVLQTPAGHSISLVDLPGPGGGITIQLKGPDGPTISLTDSGIELSCGPGKAAIKLTGSTVTINDGALAVS